MKPRRDEELDSLLGHGGMGAARRDAILGRVLANTKAEAPKAVRLRWFFAATGALAVAAVAAFLVRPPSTQVDLSTFRSKGTAPSTRGLAPSVRLECLSGTLDACPMGSLLVVHAAGVRGYVSAWAEPVGGGERIWYFSAETFTPQVDDGTAQSTNSRAVRIGTEHAGGKYVVEIRVTEHPMSPTALLRLNARDALAAVRAQLTVTPP
jgi:hypothetical protein